MPRVRCGRDEALLSRHVAPHEFGKIIAQDSANVGGGIGTPERGSDSFGAGIVRMNDANVKGVIWQRLHTGTGIAPDKACIFSNVDKFKAIVGPEGSMVAEGTARNPGPLVCRIDVLPGLPTQDIVKQYRVNTTDIAISVQ